MDPLRQALAMRRGKGLSISDIQPPEEGGKRSDLAPDAPGMHHPGDGDGETGAISVPGEEHPHDLAMNLQDRDLIGAMSQGDLKDMMGRAPRSLGERARQHMVEKDKSKGVSETGTKGFPIKK